MLARTHATFPVLVLLLLACSSDPDSFNESGIGGAGGNLSGGGDAGGLTGLGGATVGGAMSGGATSGGATSGGVTVGGTMSGGATSGGATSGGATVGGAVSGGSAGESGNAGAAGGESDCPFDGHISYQLTRAASPTEDQSSAYGLITDAMDEAVAYYNCYAEITKALNISYEPSVATADGNINGSIRFGSTASMNYITAMHEISHTVGVGTASNWSSMVSGGIFTGAHATAELRAITGIADDQLHADTQHFWPYGLNYTSEVSSTADLINHCFMVTAIREDLGLN